MTETDVLNYFSDADPASPPGSKDSRMMWFHLQSLSVQEGPLHRKDLAEVKELQPTANRNQ